MCFKNWNVLTNRDRDTQLVPGAVRFVVLGQALAKAIRFYSDDRVGILFKVCAPTEHVNSDGVFLDPIALT